MVGRLEDRRRYVVMHAYMSAQNYHSGLIRFKKLQVHINDFSSLFGLNIVTA